jgi:heme a synthase
MAQATDNVNAPTPRWLQALSVLTVLCALPLLTLGAEVTTKDVGMVDQAPIRSPLHLLQVVEELGGWQRVIQEKGIGWVIEHSHRFVGWLVGLLTIGLVIGLFRCESRRWLRWAAFAALLAVGLQGLLGILRVDLNNRFGPEVGRNLALIHGCTAQLVLALLVAIAVWTSLGWYNMGSATTADSPRARHAALVLVCVMYLQIVFGAIIRHKAAALGLRLHVLMAFGTVAAAVWASVALLHGAGMGTMARRTVTALWVALVCQILLGMETLLSRFSVSWAYTLEKIEPVTAVAPDFPRSLHVMVGALSFAAAVSMLLVAHRHAAWAKPAVATTPSRQLEAAV